MARKRKTADLPESFEDFAQTMQPKAQPIGGMVKTKWAGNPMWKCPRCNGTTFDEGASKVHQCKQPRFADEADE